MSSSDATHIVEISVIIPVGPEPMASSLHQLYTEYRAQLERHGRPYEFLIILEGAADREYQELIRLCRGETGIRIFTLSQSHADATSLIVGLEHARGDIILTLPAYHQIEPDEIQSILSATEGGDVVVVRRWPRVDSFWSQLQTKVYHGLLRMTIGATYKDLGCGVRVVRRQVIDAIHIYGHKHWFLPVLADRLGFHVKEVEARQASGASSKRRQGSGFYVRRLLDLLSVFFLVNFTKKPLRFFGLSGIILLGTGLALTGFLGFQRLFMGVALADRPALLLGVLLIVFGFQILAIGLIGELIIFTHAKDLEDYRIDQIVEFKSDS